MNERRASTMTRRAGWRDRALMAAAFATILACTLGLGPFAAGGPAKAPTVTAQLLR